jgi:hypothetical protein
VEARVEGAEGDAIVEGERAGTWWDAAAAVGLGALGAALALASTQHGVRLTSDSVAYLAMARRFGASPSAFFGPGSAPVVDQLNHWSPLVGLVLAWTRWFDADPLVRARAVAVASAAALGLLAFVIVRRRAARPVAIVASLILLLSTEVLEAVGTLGSEVVYFPLVLLTILTLDVAIGGARLRPGWLVAASAVGALACTARVIGLSSLLALLVCCWVLCRREDRKLAVGIAVAAGLAPAAIWSVVYGSDRQLGFHPPTGRVNEVATTMSRWVVPSSIELPSVVRALVAVLIGAAILAVVVRWARTCRRSGLVGPDRLLLILLVDALAYVVAVLASSTFFDSEISFQARILYPVLLAVVLAGAVEVGRPERPGERPVPSSGVRVAAAVVAVALVVVFGAQTAADLGDPPGADDYQRSEITDSPTLRAVDRLPDGLVIYSNARIPLALFHGRSARAQPWDREQGAPSPSDLEPMLSRLRGTSGRIVYLDAEEARSDLPPLDELESIPGIVVVERFDDGAILRVDG